MTFGRLTVAAVLCSTLIPLSAGGQQHAIDESANAPLLFVASGRSGSIDGDQLTLEGVPSVLYFSDRPARIAGHMSVRAFVELWNEGPDSFAQDPPNAVLSVLDTDSDENVVVELTGIRLEGDGLSFDFGVVRGRAPRASFGPASLFIDCLAMIFPCNTH